MRNGKAAVILLAIVTATLCVGTIAWVEVPTAGAESASVQQADRFPVEQGAARTPGPAPLPLRWHVDYVSETNGVDNTYCSTTVVVRNVTSTSVTAQVEWFVWTGVSFGYQEVSVASGRVSTVTSNNNVNVRPFYYGTDADLGDFVGYANVHADDPRIHVSAYFICRDDEGLSANLVAMMPVGTSPVGATMEYFQARMPAAWAPPMVVPEAPE